MENQDNTPDSKCNCCRNFLSTELGQKLKRVWKMKTSYIKRLVGTAAVLCLVIFKFLPVTTIYSSQESIHSLDELVLDLSSLKRLEIKDSTFCQDEKYGCIEENCLQQKFSIEIDKHDCVKKVHINKDVFFNRVVISSKVKESGKVYFNSKKLRSKNIFFYGYDITIKADRIQSENVFFDSYLGSFKVEDLIFEKSYINTSKGDIAIQTKESVTLNTITKEKYVCATCQKSWKDFSSEVSNLSEVFKEKKEEDQQCLVVYKYEYRNQQDMVDKEKHSVFYEQNAIYTLNQDEVRCNYLENLILMNNDNNPITVPKLKEITASNYDGNIYINVLSSSNRLEKQVTNVSYQNENITLSEESQNNLNKTVRSIIDSGQTNEIVYLDFRQSKDMTTNFVLVLIFNPIYLHLTPEWLSALSFGAFSSEDKREKISLQPGLCPYIFSYSMFQDMDYQEKLVELNEQLILNSVKKFFEKENLDVFLLITWQDYKNFKSKQRSTYPDVENIDLKIKYIQEVNYICGIILFIFIISSFITIQYGLFQLKKRQKKRDMEKIAYYFFSKMEPPQKLKQIEQQSEQKNYSSQTCLNDQKNKKIELKCNLKNSINPFQNISYTVLSIRSLNWMQSRYFNSLSLFLQQLLTYQELPKEKFTTQKKISDLKQYYQKFCFLFNLKQECLQFKDEIILEQRKFQYQYKQTIVFEKYQNNKMIEKLINEIEKDESKIYSESQSNEQTDSKPKLEYFIVDLPVYKQIQYKKFLKKYQIKGEKHMSLSDFELFFQNPDDLQYQFKDIFEEKSNISKNKNAHGQIQQSVQQQDIESFRGYHQQSNEDHQKKDNNSLSCQENFQNNNCESKIQNGVKSPNGGKIMNEQETYDKVSVQRESYFEFKYYGEKEVKQTSDDVNFYIYGVYTKVLVKSHIKNKKQIGCFDQFKKKFCCRKIGKDYFFNEEFLNYIDHLFAEFLSNKLNDPKTLKSQIHPEQYKIHRYDSKKYVSHLEDIQAEKIEKVKRRINSHYSTNIQRCYENSQDIFTFLKLFAISFYFDILYFASPFIGASFSIVFIYIYINQSLKFNISNYNKVDFRDDLMEWFKFGVAEMSLLIICVFCFCLLFYALYLLQNQSFTNITRNIFKGEYKVLSKYTNNNKRNCCQSLWEKIKRFYSHIYSMPYYILTQILLLLEMTYICVSFLILVVGLVIFPKLRLATLIFFCALLFVLIKTIFDFKSNYDIGQKKIREEFDNNLKKNFNQFKKILKKKGKQDSLNSNSKQNQIENKTNIKNPRIEQENTQKKVFDGLQEGKHNHIDEELDKVLKVINEEVVTNNIQENQLNQNDKKLIKKNQKDSILDKDSSSDSNSEISQSDNKKSIKDARIQKENPYKKVFEELQEAEDKIIDENDLKIILKNLKMELSKVQLDQLYAYLFIYDNDGFDTIKVWKMKKEIDCRKFGLAIDYIMQKKVNMALHLLDISYASLCLSIVQTFIQSFIIAYIIYAIQKGTASFNSEYELFSNIFVSFGSIVGLLFSKQDKVKVFQEKEKLKKVVEIVENEMHTIN